MFFEQPKAIFNVFKIPIKFMTLIVGRIFEKSLFMIGDTKITYPDFQKQSPVDGLGKIIIINPNVCVSIAGDVETADAALKAINQKSNIDEIKEILISYHNESNYETEFLIGIGGKSSKLYTIKGGECMNSQNSWIGSHSAFAKYQFYYHNHKEFWLLKEKKAFNMRELPFNDNENGNNIYSAMFIGILGVIEDPQINEVDGFVTPVVFLNDSFHFKSYNLIYRKFKDWNSEHFFGRPDSTFNSESSEEGAYTINFAKSFTSKILIHLFNANLAIVYKNEKGGLLIPEFIKDIDEIDLFESIENDEKIAFSFAFQKFIFAYTQKAINYAKGGNLKKALEYLTKGIKLSSSEWESPHRIGNEFDNIFDFRKARGNPIFSDKLKGHLALAFFLRGKAYYDMENYQAALEEFNQAYFVNPNDLKTITQKAIQEFLVRKPNLALSTITKGINMFEDAASYSLRGEFYCKLGVLKLAKIDLLKSLEIDPMNAWSSSR